MDYTSFNGSGESSRGYNYRWWLENKSEDLAHAIFSVCKQLEKTDSVRQQQNIRSLRLYGNLEILGFNPLNYSRIPLQSNNFSESRLKLNIVASMADTLASKIAKNKPRPLFLTSAGSWDLKGKAKKLQKFTDGAFYQTDLYRIAPKLFLDSLIFGAGVAKIFHKEGKICVERVFPSELLIDNAESLYGQPRQIHQKKYVSKEVLIDAFPSHKADIEMATQRTIEGEPNVSNQVLVIESWHLPSGKNSKDGKHVICIDKCVLFQEKYEKDSFPFVFLKWSERLLGFWPQGLAEQLQGIQLEINKTLKNIATALALCAVPRVYVEAGSKVVKSHISNEIGSIITYQGVKPMQEVAQAVSPELFQHLENLYRKAYEVAGISQLSAQAAKPAGLNSGVALREYNDIETDRFTVVGQRYEDFFLDCARLMVRIAKEAAAEGDSISVKVPGKQFSDEITWDEIDVDLDSVVIQMFPTSMLPQTPAGRLQMVQELTQAGMIPPEVASDLLAFPDLDKYMQIKNAPMEDIEHTLERIIYEGEYLPPEPFQDLNLGVSRSQALYLWAKNNNCPEDRLELLRRWHDEAQYLLNQAQQPPVNNSPMGGPQAVPEASPTSDLIPNIPA